MLCSLHLYVIYCPTPDLGLHTEPYGSSHLLADHFPWVAQLVSHAVASGLHKVSLIFIVPLLVL